MKQKSVTKNALLSVMQSITSIVFPLITFPYISRVLGVVNIGVYNFSQNFVYYFIFFAGLGINTYAVREGARIRDEKKKIEEFSGNILSINMYTTILSYTCLLLLLFTVSKFEDYRGYILILSIQIIFITIGRAWIYSIYEEFLYVSIRNIICQCIALGLMFVFVKTEKDLLNYCIVSISAIILSNLLNLAFSRKLCRIRFYVKPDMSHLKPILLIFSMTVSVVIYSNTDIVILGFLTSDYNVGLYSVSVKIYTMIKQIIAAGLTVTIPRFSFYIGNNDDNSYRRLFDSTYNCLILVLVPAICGMAILSKEIVCLISGVSFLEASTSFLILSLSMIFNLISYLYGYCVLLPNRDDKAFFFATLVGAGLNAALNFLLIPSFYQNAAAFTTLLSEASVMVICIIKARRYISYRIISNNNIPVLIGSIIILAICYTIKLITNEYYLVLLISIPLSVVAYSVVQIVFKNTYFIGIVNSLLRKTHIKKRVKISGDQL